MANEDFCRYVDVFYGSGNSIRELNHEFGSLMLTQTSLIGVYLRPFCAAEPFKADKYHKKFKKHP